MSRLDPVSFARQYVGTLTDVLRELPLDTLGRAMAALCSVYESERRIFIAGNGGSAATASHMANDLSWGMTQIGKPAFRVYALTDNVPLITAIANDDSYAQIFAHQLRPLAHAGDVLLVITGSGNSPNIVRVLEVAKEMGLLTIGFLGKGGGVASKMVDIPVVVPSEDYGPIEDIHMMFDHLMIAYFKNYFGAKS